jgi:hypothetical protein
MKYEKEILALLQKANRSLKASEVLKSLCSHHVFLERSLGSQGFIRDFI